MDAFHTTLGFIRPEASKLPSNRIQDLNRLNEVLLDHFLWFLPVPRGFAANQEPALHLLHTRRVKKALKTFCEWFEIEQEDKDTFSGSLQFMFDKCPSLQSMTFVDHDPKVLNAWIYLMVHHKNLVSKIGPKNDFQDDLFVKKVASMANVTDSTSDNSWISMWASLLRQIEETSFENVLSETEVTALPEGSIAQNHFVANYCCSEDIIQSLQRQREPLQSLGKHSKVDHLDSQFWVDPEPVFLDSFKTFRVVVYKSENS